MFCLFRLQNNCFVCLMELSVNLPDFALSVYWHFYSLFILSSFFQANNNGLCYFFTHLFTVNNTVRNFMVEVRNFPMELHIPGSVPCTSTKHQPLLNLHCKLPEIWLNEISIIRHVILESSAGLWYFSAYLIES